MFWKKKTEEESPKVKRMKKLINERDALLRANPYSIWERDNSDKRYAYERKIEAAFEAQVNALL